MLSCQNTFNTSKAIVRVIPEVLIAIEILSASAVKRLAVEQESNELGVATSNETASYKFLHWNYKLQVTS